jgi:AraC-like DNA-binding protein
MQTAECHRLTIGSVTDRLGELLAVDLNPVGHALRLAFDDVTYRRIWGFFNERGNVVSKIGYDGSRVPDHVELSEVELQSTRGEKKNVLDAHEKMLFSYQNVLLMQLRQNQDPRLRDWKLEDSKVSAVARIYGAGQLILELSEFFEEFPAAKVSDACRSLTVHPRLLERRMNELGMTAVKLKRACMLSRATHEILWGQRSFGEIAKNCGYSHGAHLNRAVYLATGGMTPSFLRSLVR